MKKTLLFLGAYLCSQAVFAQDENNNKPDTSIRSIDLGEVVIKSTEPDGFSNKVRTQNVFIVLNPTRPGVIDAKMDSTFYVTRFPQPEHDPISLYAVDLKLKQFDTGMFDIRLIVFQVQGKDTLRRTVPVDASKIDRKDKLRIVLFEENITLQPGDFYIGFGFHPKRIPETYKYRMYSTNKGEGAILTFKSGGVDLVSNPHFPYVFPFKMSYRKS